MTKKSAFILSFPIVFWVSIVGCDAPRPEGLPDLQPTVLSFTQEGTPLADATVTLYPQGGGSSRWGGGGVTDVSGKVTIKTQNKYPGLGVGKYRIAVSKSEYEPIPAGKRKSEEDTEWEYTLVDPKYCDSSKTDLEIDIVDGKNDETFDLGKPVRILLNP